MMNGFDQPDPAWTAGMNQAVARRHQVRWPFRGNVSRFKVLQNMVNYQ